MGFVFCELLEGDRLNCYQKNKMKKIFVVLLLVVMGLLSTQAVLAGGDKVRGEESEGPSYQEGECPFVG